ncbi:VCBS repeat-containing protein [uncultured Photobacterium sp.]|uniref:FG-GAP repeat domain-containing protein n=1 Tax=uncultured Photobacterium sp. TaxID=173973 RepID=UPI002611B4BA|nr:VCBS repeat-containing protein [uncultured Photobacterium sp.]
MLDINKVLITLALVLTMTGCGGGNDNPTPNPENIEQFQELQQKVQFNPTFAAQFFERSQTAAPQIQKRHARSFENVTAADAPTTDIRYKGKMTITDTLNNQTRQLEWPLTLKSDGTVVSHRTLALEPGNYDFVVLLEHNGHQYTAQSLAVDVVHNQPLIVDLKLQPHLGDTLINLDDIGGLSKLNFSYPAEELKSLNNPKLGIAIGDGDELIFDLNKETGLSEITLAYKEGDYPLALNLYDDNRLVGVIQQADTVINLHSGEASEVNLIPLQADVDFRLNINDHDNTSKFNFTVPQALVERVGGAEKLAMVLRLSSSTETQETLRFFHEENDRYISTDGTPLRFDTQGQERVSAYLTFYPKSQDNQYNEMPLASCTFFVDVGINQNLSCKLSVDASHRIHGHILASLMLNVQHSDLTMAKGAKVYIDDKLIGLTGSEYSTSSLKTHLLAGEHKVKIEKEGSIAELTLTLSPLDVVNKLVYLEERPKGSGVFVDSGQRFSDTGSVEAVALGDVNGDGFLDIVQANAYNEPNYIFLNDGTGKFTDSGQRLGKNHTTSIALGDMNGDGHLDIVAGNSARFSDDGNVNYIYFNDGRGNFTDIKGVSGNNNTASIALGDMNGDSYLDIVEGNSGKAHDKIYINDGQGKMTHIATPYGTDKNTKSIALGDMNEDGYLDVFVGNIGGASVKDYVLLNDGKGNLRDSGQKLGGGSTHTSSYGLGDVNGDGHLDIVPSNSDRAYLNDGKGKFTYSEQKMSHRTYMETVLGDIDNDGDLDIATAQSSIAAIMINDGTGNFLDGQKIEGTSSYNNKSALGDLDNDGDLDLLIAGYIQKGNSNKTIYFNQNR